MDDLERFEVTPGPGDYENNLHFTLEEMVKNSKKIDVQLERKIERGASVGPGAYDISRDISRYQLPQPLHKSASFGSKTHR